MNPEKCFNMNQTQNKHETCQKSSELGCSPEGPLGSSVSTKALVFQYTAVETVDTLGKCLCRPRTKPLRLC